MNKPHTKSAPETRTVPADKPTAIKINKPIPQQERTMNEPLHIDEFERDTEETAAQQPQPETRTEEENYYINRRGCSRETARTYLRTETAAERAERTAQQPKIEYSPSASVERDTRIIRRMTELRNHADKLAADLRQACEYFQDDKSRPYFVAHCKETLAEYQNAKGGE